MHGQWTNENGEKKIVFKKYVDLFSFVNKNKRWRSWIYIYKIKKKNKLNKMSESLLIKLYFTDD